MSGSISNGASPQIGMQMPTLASALSSLGMTTPQEQQQLLNSPQSMSLLRAFGQQQNPSAQINPQANPDAISGSLQAGNATNAMGQSLAVTGSPYGPVVAVNAPMGGGGN